MTRPLILYVTYLITFIALGILVNPLFFIGIIPLFIAVLIFDFIVDHSYESALTCFKYLPNIKRVVSDGRFYVVYKKNSEGGTKVFLFKDRFFYLYHLAAFIFIDINDTKIRIKKIQYTIYISELKDKQSKLLAKQRRKNSTTNDELKQLKQWSGCLDKTSERDQKINKIL